jgi:hypothetical protein
MRCKTLHKPSKMFAFEATESLQKLPTGLLFSSGILVRYKLVSAHRYEYLTNKLRISV